MEQKPNERAGFLGAHSTKKSKLGIWADTRTEELESLYASMREQISSIPSAEWDECDEESFKVIGDIVSKRRAEAVRQELARMMELAGVSYGIQRVIQQRKASARRRLNKDKR
ncbi:MAG: hypothetical protein ACON31_00120 [Candidatus Puniceispirillaceae bacterium]